MECPSVNAKWLGKFACETEKLMHSLCVQTEPITCSTKGLEPLHIGRLPCHMQRSTAMTKLLLRYKQELKPLEKKMIDCR